MGKNNINRRHIVKQPFQGIRRIFEGVRSETNARVEFPIAQEDTDFTMFKIRLCYIQNDIYDDIHPAAVWGKWGSNCATFYKGRGTNRGYLGFGSYEAWTSMIPVGKWTTVVVTREGMWFDDRKVATFNATFDKAVAVILSIGQQQFTTPVWDIKSVEVRNERGIVVKAVPAEKNGVIGFYDLHSRTFKTPSNGKFFIKSPY